MYLVYICTKSHAPKVELLCPKSLDMIPICYFIIFKSCMLMLASTLQDVKGNDVDLSTYKGKVLLIVNVASKWYYASASFFLLYNYYKPNYPKKL